MSILKNFPATLPTLSLNFAKTRALGPRVEFTRTSVGTYVGADGLIKTAASGAPRFDHDPVTRESLGLLVEEARTNNLLYSEQFDNSNWGKQGGFNITPNTAIAPDGTLTADTASRTDLGAQYLYQTINLTGTSTLSCWVRAVTGTTTFIMQSYNGINGGFVSATFTATTTWQRFSFTATVTTSNNWYPCVPLVSGDQLYIWGAQLESGSFPTSYIPTTTAVATRAAEVATIPNTNSTLFPTSSFTTISTPFGTVGGATTVRLIGPTIKSAAVYSGDLPQAQINALTKTTNFWRWRVVGGSFALPNFTTNGTVTVDWGDGVVETLTTAVHTFTNGSGYHDIGFRLNSGTVFKPYLNNNATYAPRVVAVGPAPSNMKVDGLQIFRGCSLLRGMDGYADYTGGTSFANAWESCVSLASFPLINTSGVTNFSVAWTNCSALTSFPLINTASATRLDYTWKNCTSLTSFPLISTGAVTDFGESWGNCNKLTSFPLINTAATTSLQATWKDCSSLTSFPLINTAAVTNLSSTWQSCSALSSFPLINTAAVTNFTYTWLGCGLTSFPLINTSAGTNFSGTWQTCPGLTSFPLINVSAGTNFTGTWRSSTGLTAMPALTFNSATTLFQAWAYCTNLATFPANAFNTTGTLVSDAFSNTFAVCALTAQSIENILTSLVTNDQSNITLSLAGGTNANTSTWSTAAKNAYMSLAAKRWSIAQNGTAPVPPLDLQFATTKTLDPRITFTRTSTGTYTDSAGVIQTAASGVARFDHQVVGIVGFQTITSLGLLVEEARTNSLTYSEDVSQWASPFNSTLTANSIAAPDGVLTADRLLETTATNLHACDGTAGTFVTSTVYTYSVFVNSIGSRNFEISFPASLFTARFARFTLSGTGAVQGVDSGVTASIQALANGWYRCSASSTCVLGASSRIGNFINDASNSRVYTGDITKGIYIWGAQLESGSFPTSYIPTTTAVATRAADVASITGTNFSSFWTNTDATYFASGRTRSDRDNNAFLGIFATDNERRLQLAINSPIYGTQSSTRIGSTFYTAAIPGNFINTEVKVATIVTTTAIGISVNGSAVVTTTTPSLSAGNPTFMDIGRFGSDSAYSLQGTISRLTYYPFRLGNVALQALTAP